MAGKKNKRIPLPPRETLIELYESGMNYNELAKMFDASPPTISAWFKHYGIRARRPQVEKKIINGKVYRKCFGPNHDETNCWQPIEKFWKNAAKSGGTQPRCVVCKGVKQRVKLTPTYQAWITSIVRRLGMAESCRRLGVHDVTVRTWMGKVKKKPPPTTLKREHAEAIVRVLGELRYTGEVRHRASIKRGASVRGETERKVTSPKHLYHRTDGNSDTEYRRQYRRRLKERLTEAA